MLGRSWPPERPIFRWIRGKLNVKETVSVTKAMPHTWTSEANREPPAELGSAEHISTRERILEIALDLFTTQGYDKTSMHEIAERLGFSKAAIFYHFASKQDILVALHSRLHEFGRNALNTVEREEASPEVWMTLLERLIDQILELHDLFVLQERNLAALANLHRERHISEHDLLEDWFRLPLVNQEIALRDRVRMACAFKAVMGVLDLVDDVFSEVPSATLAALLREAVNDLMASSLAPEQLADGRGD
jgi:AcrR family transcriptional regulator